MKEKAGALVIPRYLVTVRFVDIPSTEEAEIEKMVEFQAVKEVPYSKEEMITSYRNLGSFKDGFSSVMLVIAKKDMIEEGMSRKEKDGVKPEVIRLGSELLYLFSFKKGAIKPDAVNLLIHFSKGDSEIMVIDKTRPVFSRGFEARDRFFEEIDRSMQAYERDKDKPEIQNIVVVYDSGVDIGKMRQYAKDHFSIPSGFYEYGEDLAGLDLPAKIDLLPKEITARKAQLTRKYEMLLTYSLAGLIVVVCFAFFSLKLHEKSKLLDVLSLKLSQMESKIEDLDRFAKKTDIAKRHRADGDFIIEILKQSYALLPGDAALSGLDYDGETSISFKGTSEESSTVYSFVKTLEKSNIFSKVEVKHATKKKVRGKELTDFDIRCRIGN